MLNLECPWGYNMPKLIIPKESLPDVNIFTDTVFFRFKIISDDKNISSYWSSIYSIDSGNIYVNGSKSIPGTLYLEKHSGYVSAVWDSVSVYKTINSIDTLINEIKNYDVWVRFSENGGANPSEWIYKERVSSSSLNILIPSQYESNGNFYSPKFMYVEVYRPGNPIARYESISHTITQNGSSVDILNDSITTSSEHKLKTGDSVLYTAGSPIGGLSSGILYWARPISATSFNIFENKNDALENINKINLTSTGSGPGQFSHYPFLAYKALITTL